MPTTTHHIRVWDTATTSKDFTTTLPIAVDDSTRIVFTDSDGHKHDIVKANKYDIETWDTTV
jgi:hypothetical protein